MRGSDERGMALPLAVLALLIAVQLTMALTALSAPEVAIGENHLLAVRARAAAESGLEAVRIALSNPHALSTAFPPAASGAPLIRIPSTGAGYRVAVSLDPGWSTFEKANQRRVTAAGIAAPGDPVDLDTAPNRAVRTLEAIMRRDSLSATLLVPAPALLAGGGLLGGEIDSRRDPAADFEPWCTRPGQTVPPLGGAAAAGAHRFENEGLVWGPGDSIPNEVGRDLLDRDAAPPDFLFANYAFTAEELAALKALAIATGTFHRASPAVFAAHAPLPPAGAVVYVEGDIEIEAYGNDTVWTGWLVAVNPSGPGSGGRITLRCLPGCSPAWARLTVNGLLYAEDRLAVSTEGANRALTVNGAVITRNLGGTPNRIEPERTGDVRISLRCQGDGGARRGVRDAIAGTADTIGVFDRSGRSGWFLKPGSYREIAGQP
jgi:hypothetical protein